MLHVQRYLQNKTVEELSAELGIKAAVHPHLPLVILNYDQIESPKTHPIVRECRGLVLRSDTFDLVAKSFSRFFNWGELTEEMALFDFSDFTVQSKEDGSLCLIYYFDGQWHANTRGSFALDLMQHQQFTWREGFCKALGVKDLSELQTQLHSTITYVCEFCSVWNKVVRKYDEPQMFLLTAFRGLQELSHDELEALMPEGLFKRPIKYQFHSIEEIQQFLQEQGANDPTFEGVVIRDKNGMRYKVKSATYLGLHKLRGEGDNLFHPKHLLPFVLAGEEDELLNYYPEVTEQFYKLKSHVLSDYSKVLETWADHKDIQDQKTFALAVKDHPYSGVLFRVRKEYGLTQKSKDLRTVWKDSDDLILKKLRV